MPPEPSWPERRSLNWSRPVHAAGSDEIRIALIGCGGRGRGAAQNNLNACENTRIVAVADAFQGNAENQAKAHNVSPEKTFWGLDAYQKAIEAGVEMVILATPPGFRPLHYKAAIEAGKHVFMEKPCCVDAAGYRSLLETNKLADEKGLKVGVGLQRRHNAGYVNGIQQIHDGKFGDLILLQAYWNGGGIWWRNPPSESATEMEKQVHNWYHYVWLSGDNISRAARPQPGRLQLGEGCTPGRSQRDGRRRHPPTRSAADADLRPSLRRIHLSGRHENVQPVPTRPGLLQQSG